MNVVERNDFGLFKILYQHSPGGIKKNLRTASLYTKSSTQDLLNMKQSPNHTTVTLC